MKRKLSSVLFSSMLVGVITLGASSCAGKVLSFWNGFGTLVANTLNPIVENYANVSDDGYKMNVTAYGGYDNLYKAIDLGVSTKTYPNLAVAYPDHMATYISKYILIPLDAYLEEAGMDLDGYIPSYLNENQAFGNYSDSHPTLAGKPRTYGVPFNKSTELFVYNETFFDWISTENPDIVLPTTWDEMSSSGKAIREVMANKEVQGAEKGVYGKIVTQHPTTKEWDVAENTSKIKNGYVEILDFSAVKESAFYPFGYDSNANLFITVLRQFESVYTAFGLKDGGEVDTSRGTYDFTKAANWAATKDALMMVAGLFRDKVLGLPVPNFNGSRYCSSAFKALQTVGVVGSSGGLNNNVITNPRITVNIAPIPYNGEAGDGKGKSVISQGTNLVCFAKGEKEIVPTVKAINYLTSEVNLQFCMETGYFPVRKDDRENPIYTEFLAKPSDDSATELRRLGANTTNYEYTDPDKDWDSFVDPGFQGSSQIRENVGQILDNLAGNSEITSRTDEQLLDLIVDNIIQVSKNFSAYKPRADLLDPLFR